MGASSDTIMTGDDAHREAQVNLIHLPPAQRQQFYKEVFSKRVEPLTHISEPDECNEWPDLRDEILEAYLRYTTFSVKVWANYDAAAKQFYIDNRIHDCGKLVLKPSQEAYVNGHRKLEFSRVRLEIGTPFTTICDVKFSAIPSKLNVGSNVTARVGRFNADHPRLVDFVQNVCTEFNESDVATADGQGGLMVADIEGLAMWFCRQPTQGEINKTRWSTNAGAWMDFHDERSANPGWLDLEALDKECAFGCNGCTDKRYTRFGGGSTSLFWG